MKPRLVDLTPKQRMLHLVVERPHKPAVGGSVIAWLLALLATEREESARTRAAWQALDGEIDRRLHDYAWHPSYRAALAFVQEALRALLSRGAS